MFPWKDKLQYLHAQITALEWVSECQLLKMKDIGLLKSTILFIIEKADFQF